MKQNIRDAMITIATLVAVFILVLVLQRFFAVARLIPMLFVLGVFIVALNTKGYFWGVAASLP